MTPQRLCAFALTILWTMPALRADADFPSQGLLPKEETGALRFLAEHGDYDGRGVVVAIFDTGVDPGAAGLQTTTDGKSKIVDLVDGTGSGDVDTSTVRKVKKGVLTGLTGRPLKVPQAWKNPSGDYHVGWKRGYELYPKALRERIEKRRRETWDTRQRELETRLREALLAYDAEEEQGGEQDKEAARRRRRQREELALRIEVLKAAQKKYQDPGPIYDCVVFHDGQLWQAAIDTDEDGDLGDERLMTNFRTRRQYATFDDVSLLNFAVNIYDDGNLLSIVTDCGWHGTHVAGIVAGHFPDQPELNGVAPGAQIVSVKIGDNRKGTSSTGAGEVRGLISVLQNKCDLINMSYGGATNDPNSGRVVDLYSDIVNKHGVIFVASAGNSGPALQTTVSPGGTSSAIFGVGAYVSPALMSAAHSQLEAYGELPYTWTSRGPVADGDLGVDFTAPGGAVSPVSKWSLDKYLLANGTSMSSPNACGGIALLLSGLKAENRPYSPDSVKRALKNTARRLEQEDVFAHGPGLIQIDRAYSYLVENADKPGERVRFQIDLPARGNDRGIYLRDGEESNRVLETQLRVRPRFPTSVTAAEKAKFEMRFLLETTADWIAAPKHVVTAQGGRSVGIRVDPTELEPGAHFGEVLGFDAWDRDRGPLFRLPVTVIRCEEERPVLEGWTETLSFQPGDLQRRFLHVPQGASWFDVRIRAGETTSPRRLVLHALQRLPRRGYFRSHQRAFINMSPGAEVVRSFPVAGGRTLELCLGQYWSSLGESEFQVELKFHGLRPDQQGLVVDGSLLSTRVELTSPIRDERLAPAAQLEWLRRQVLPLESVTRPLNALRDQLPDSRRIHELILTYRFDNPVEARVKLRLAAVEHDELSGTYESRLYQLFDINKRLLPRKKDGAQLAKGSYVVRFHLRHDDPSMLDKLKRTMLLVDRKLSKPLKLSVHHDPDEVLQGGSLKPRRVEKGERVVIYLGHIQEKNLPSKAQPGDRLLGTLTLGERPAPRAGAGMRPGGYDLQYTIPPRADSQPDTKQPSDEARPDKEPLDFKLQGMLTQLEKFRAQKDRDAALDLTSRILKHRPKHMPTLVARLHLLDDVDRKKHLPDIVKAADAIIAGVSRKQLAQHFGTRVDPDDEQAVKLREKLELEKSRLVDALYRKGRAIAYMDLPPTPSQPPMEIPKHPRKRKARDRLFEKNYAELRKWVDMSDDKYVLLNIRRERRQQRFAHALQLLDKALESSPFRQLLYKKRGDIYGELGWHDWRAYELQWKIIRFPDNYPPF